MGKYGDYQGRVCQSGRLRPSAADLADHERLCELLEKLFKEVGGIKMTASLGLQFLTRSEEAQSLLRGALARILNHRERVLAITEELREIDWLEAVLPAAEP